MSLLNRPLVDAAIWEMALQNDYHSQGSKYPNTRHLPKTTTAAPTIEARSMLWVL